jgi:DNA-binding transcriptional LysR family regulator
MELRQLEHFVAVAEERHFSRAARRVHIVQSGLSSSIRALERELGAELFVRSTRRVELSEVGRALLPEARRVLEAADAAREAAAAVEGLLRGTLSVGIMQILGTVDLPGLLCRFHHEHSEVELRLRQAAALRLVDEVRAGELDLAFIGLPADDLEDVEATTVMREPMALACSATHPFAHRKVVRLADLRDESFVDFEPEWGVRIAVDRAFADARVDRHVGFELNDTRTLLELVSSGLGVSVVPSSVVSYGVPIVLVPLRGHGPTWEVSLVTRRDGAPSAAARVLIAMLPGHPSEATPTSARRKRG